MDGDSGRPIQAATERAGAVGAGDGTDSSKKRDAFCTPVLDKETLLEHLPALAIYVLTSNQSLLGVTEIHVLTLNQSLGGDATKDKGLRQFLLSMPYTLFLFAVAGLAIAVAIKRKPRMLGCAAGTLLAQFVCLVLMGGIVTQVRGEVDLRIVWPVTVVILAALLLVWSVLCAYPKWVRWLLCRCCSKEEEEEDEKEKVDDGNKCKICGKIVVNGRSPNLASEGVHACEGCGGVGRPSV